MENMWQLFFNGLEGRTSIITVHKDASVDELMKKVEERNGIPLKEQRIIFGGKQLQYGADKYLRDYSIENNSNLFVVLRLKGGSDEQETKELDDLVELSDAPDMITWDDDPENKRAKMPCGHAIGPESLTAFCRSILTAGKYQFRCPYINPENQAYCGEEWEYFIVRRLAVLTADEKAEFEKKLTENYLRKACGIQECPKCHSLCERASTTDRRVVCPLCSSKLGTEYEFCWYCLHEWNDKRSTKKCGNSACSNEDPRLKILRDCPKKEIVGVKNCPSCRACILCGLLIEHEKACKHMVCPCGTKFCFICLTGADGEGRYQCGTYNSPCEPKEVQTTVPGA